MSGPIRVVALHGFLGSPRDWDGLHAALCLPCVEALDLWRLLEESGATDWAAAGRALDAHLRGTAGTREGQDRAGARAVVLAYSFGARLALASDTLARGDASIAGACLVSCNPGLAEGDVAGREARREADEQWATRLLEAAEDDICRAWKSQPLLQSPGPVRSGAPASQADGLPAARATLARAMRSFSLAGQPDFRPRLQRWRTPLLWVTGEADTKFSTVADGLERDGVPATFARCPNAGHRVPWDNPEGFAALFTSWLRQL